MKSPLELPDVEGNFNIVYVTVDGAGSSDPAFTSLHAAVRYADQEQENADNGRYGNSWCCIYIVYGYREREVYRTTMNQEKHRRGQKQLLWDTMLGIAIRTKVDPLYPRGPLYEQYSRNSVALGEIPLLGVTGIHTIQILEPPLGDATIEVVALGENRWEFNVLECPTLQIQEGERTTQ